MNRPLNCRILLVEDNEDHQSLLSLLLRRAGSEVAVAANGLAAVDMAQDASGAGRPFDLILMDVQMPVLDGLAATRQLRALGFTNPIIALTARALPSERDLCFQAGCSDFIAKPIGPTELVVRVASHLAH